ncbi:DUF2399 domain-containing protein [Nocardia sp. MW-W600-9]
MGSRDYQEAVSAGIPRIPLAGRSVATPWDPDLQAAMERAEQAVHEESVLNSLISDL